MLNTEVNNSSCVFLSSKYTYKYAYLYIVTPEVKSHRPTVL